MSRGKSYQELSPEEGRDRGPSPGKTREHLGLFDICFGASRSHNHSYSSLWCDNGGEQHAIGAWLCRSHPVSTLRLPYWLVAGELCVREGRTRGRERPVHCFPPCPGNRSSPWVALPCTPCDFQIPDIVSF